MTRELGTLKYVKNGILRFVQAEHGYGKSAPSGAMVGYIRSMTSTNILNEVNGHAARENLSNIELPVAGWCDDGVTRLEQQLDRPAVLPSPFSLRHLWVDLRRK